MSHRVSGSQPCLTGSQPCLTGSQPGLTGSRPGLSQVSGNSTAFRAFGDTASFFELFLLQVVKKLPASDRLVHFELKNVRFENTIFRTGGLYLTWGLVDVTSMLNVVTKKISCWEHVKYEFATVIHGLSWMQRAVYVQNFLLTTRQQVVSCHLLPMITQTVPELFKFDQFESRLFFVEMPQLIERHIVFAEKHTMRWTKISENDLASCGTYPFQLFRLLCLLRDILFPMPTESITELRILYIRKLGRFAIQLPNIFGW
jgi:hypothetical protein